MLYNLTCLRLTLQKISFKKADLKSTRIFTAEIKMIFLLIVFGFSSLPVLPQGEKTINLEEIPQKKVRQYIVSKSIDQMHDFSLIHASWRKGINESDFKVVEETFYLKYKLSSVWQFYSHANLVKLWDGQSVRFGLLISKRSNSVIYKDAPLLPRIDTGQVYFLDIRFIKGVFDIPMAFEIINIDPVQQLVEFSYIDGNKASGKQTIQFFDNGEGRTRIVHRSYFKSESTLRDDVLYPYFHKKFVKEFHKNMRLLIRHSKYIACG
jgi:hypothetical protein